MNSLNNLKLKTDIIGIYDIASRVQKNGFFEHGCAKKRNFCTRDVKVFGVQKNGFFALRVRKNGECEKTVTRVHELHTRMWYGEKTPTFASTNGTYVKHTR